MRWFAACLFFLFPSLVVGADPAPIMAMLNSGRRVTGVVDARTDSHQLWVRTVRPGVLLQSGYDWTNVAWVRHGESIYRGVDMIDNTLALRSSTETIVNDRSPAVAVRSGSAKAATPTHGLVRTVDVDAVHANWDRDADFDGLRVLVAPRDSQMKVVPSPGIVEVELLAELTSPTTTHQQFVRLGKWTRRVKAGNFASDGVRIEVPYQRFEDRRQADLNVLSDGIVHVRFKVPGQGAFEGNDAWVRMRPYSRFLDRYRLHTGRETTRYGQQPARPSHFRSIQSD